MTVLTPSSHRSIWDTGEDIAIRYLESKWYEIVDRNYQIKWGEIDLIMRTEDLMIFVEVKYRTNDSHGHPLDTFTLPKRRALKRTIMLYVAKCWLSLDHIRVDFVGIMPNSTGGHRIWHVRGVEM
jgi:putative endonuclease